MNSRTTKQGKVSTLRDKLLGLTKIKVMTNLLSIQGSAWPMSALGQAKPPKMVQSQAMEEDECP
uniref:Uncharacterized protein n=1 Tax=Salix viminalis TaxID=40686 RepID=A0A6N2LB37_SALVM